MALNTFTASQGVVCALVGVECCVYIPNVHHNVSQALRALASKTHAITHLSSNPLQEWWASLTAECWWFLAVLVGSAYVLVTCCCSIWVQGSALLTKGPLWKTPSRRIYTEEP